VAAFRLVPQSEARIYVRVPLWVKVEVAGAKERKVVETPTTILSKTWWGSFSGGELGYWIRSSARREPLVDPERWFLAICPMRIVNAADEELNVEKIMLCVAGLTLYRDEGGQIWSSLSNIRYRGGVQFTQIDVANGAPQECREGREVAPPRQPAKRSLVGKTFGELLEWAKWE
jgi:hypothetical protein